MPLVLLSDSVWMSPPPQHYNSWYGLFYGHFLRRTPKRRADYVPLAGHKGFAGRIGK
jgi:hypothetical protein